MTRRIGTVFFFWAWMWMYGFAAEDAANPVLDPMEADADLEGAREEKEALEQMARFTLALEQIHRLHATTGEETGYKELVDAAIDGMMSSLDPYSGYLGSDNLEELREQTRGSFVGIGVVINRGPQYVTVVSPIEDSPGWEAGLAAGDQIVAIDGKSARDASLENVVGRLKGEPGTEVTVRIRRPSERKTFEVTLIRSLVENKSVGGYRLLGDDVGYIRIKTFTNKTARLMRKEMTGLKKKGVNSLVLDLRGNPGGLLQSAVEVAGLFLPKDTLVVYTEGTQQEERREYRTSSRPHRLEPEVVVLVNEGSASAAEVVSGALQDHGRARLVGATTFGKASVQSILPLPDGSALRLTTAQYFTPADRAIHGKGIEPDVKVDLPMRVWLRLRSGRMEEGEWEDDPQLVRAVELLTGASAGNESEKIPEEASGEG